MTKTGQFLIMLCLTFVILSFSTATIAQSNGKYVIKETGVGIFELGKKIPFGAENYTIYEELVMREEGIEEVLYTVYKNGQQLLEFSSAFDTDSIGNILLFSDKYKTAEGIGVNSTIDDFKRAYPDFSIRYTYISDRYIMETQKNKFQFLLDGQDYIPQKTPDFDSDMTVLKPSDFKKDAKVKAIRIFSLGSAPDFETLELNFGFTVTLGEREDYGNDFTTYSYFKLERNNTVIYIDSSTEYQFDTDIFPIVLQTGDNSFELLFEVNDRPNKNYLKRLFVSNDKLIKQDNIPIPDELK